MSEYIRNIQPTEVTLEMDMAEPWRLAWIKQPKPKHSITVTLPKGQTWPSNARKGREIELDFVVNKDQYAHIHGRVTHRRMEKLVIEGVLTQYGV